MVLPTGPTENLGFSPVTPSHGNLAMPITAGAFEVCRKWFDYLWVISAPLQPGIAASLPKLVVPEGDIEAAQQWESFRKQCLDQAKTETSPVHVNVNPESGDVVLLDATGATVDSPTVEIGVPVLDLFAESIARVFDLGLFVAIDKQSRTPPVEAPVMPDWLGVESFRQTGMVSARISIKVSPFDEAMLKKIDRLRKVSGELLPRHSFALADGVRLIPKEAIPLFEAALAKANESAKQLLGTTIGDSTGSFLTSQRNRIREDTRRMYEM